MRCSACSAEIPDDSAFCNKCGRPVEAPREEKERPAPRVPEELLRQRERQAEAALQMEQARLQAVRDEVRGRRAFMIGVFVCALLLSAVLTIAVNRLQSRGRPAATGGREAAAPAGNAPAEIRLENIRLARGQDPLGLPEEPVNVLRLGMDTHVYCFFDLVGASGELTLSVQWWRLGAMEHETEVTLDLGPPTQAGGPMLRQCIDLEVPELGESGTWELRFMHAGRQVGARELAVRT